MVLISFISNRIIYNLYLKNQDANIAFIFKNKMMNEIKNFIRKVY